jgi:nucleotide-binding universal stress UspA family protein
MTTKPIVVGTDGLGHALTAVEWAAREAALRGVPLRIVSAAGMLPRMRVPSPVETVAGRLRQQRDQALACAASAAAAVAPGLPVEAVPLDGPPALAVVGSAADALLLVVGSHDGGTVAAMTLGSVSRYAVAHAACPVVVVREASTAGQLPVVVGIRIPEDCGAALAFAFAEARLRKSALRVVHAEQSLRPLTFGTPVDVELEDLLSDWRDRYPDVDASQQVVPGSPGEVLANQSADAGLVVLGRHAANSWLTPGPGQSVRAALRRARGPVVIVPPAGP